LTLNHYISDLAVIVIFASLVYVFIEITIANLLNLTFKRVFDSLNQ